MTKTKTEIERSRSILENKTSAGREKLECQSKLTSQPDAVRQRICTYQLFLSSAHGKYSFLQSDT